MTTPTPEEEARRARIRAAREAHVADVEAWAEAEARRGAAIKAAMQRKEDAA